MNKYHVQIGPALITVEAAVPSRPWPPLSYAKFEASSSESSDLTIRVRNDSPPSLKNAVHQCEVKNHWKLFKAENGFYLEVYEQIGFEAKQVIFINAEWNQADFFSFQEKKPNGFSSKEWSIGEIFAPFVQWWLTGWLASQKKGLIVHGSAVSLGDLAFAFVGPSGAGKTTIARLCRDEGGKTVLNDERIILWQGQEGWRVSGTPWSGMLYEVASLTQPLAGVCILNKATVNQFTSWASEKMLTHLLPEVFFPIWDFGRTKGLVETVSRLTQEVPCGELSFRNDASVLEYLEELIMILAGTL